MTRTHALAPWLVAAGICCAVAAAGCSAMDRPATAVAAEAATVPAAAPCGPQSPRDLGRPGGTNRLPVPGDGTRPPRLCNVHFHRPAEHTGIAACPRVEEGPGVGVCGGHGEPPVRPGEEIEFHWVYTSCPPPPVRRPGLDNCTCDRQVLMAFGQKYVVAGDGSAAGGELREPADLARYGGSTTGPEYSSGAPDDPRPCSSARVQWAVARECRVLTLAALGAWCADNEWDEDHADDARGLIVREDWLSPYVPKP